MFFREKHAGGKVYLQIVENRWEAGKSKQRVIGTLGRLDRLDQSGELAALLRSGARFAEAVMLLDAHQRAELPAVSNVRIGPALIFERLWQQSGCGAVIEELLDGRKFGFSVERAIFLTVLHRLFDPGSDRAADKWKALFKIDGAAELELHQLYRAMAWLGEVLPDSDQDARSPFSPRCVKDRVEERLFERRRTLFSSLRLVFFDTTSVYFEGAGGQSLGQYGNSKDHRPDLRQMVVGAVLDEQGQPLCCELWPGNTTDVKTLLPVVERLEKKFGIEQVCIVADRGMISRETLEALEKPGRKWLYILGAKMRAQKEVSLEVLARAGRYHVVQAKGGPGDPSPLRVKEVRVDNRRYVVCFNEDQAKKDASDREAIVEALRCKLREGDKVLVGNKGFRRYLKASGAGFQVDERKLKHEARYDGKWVLRTNTELDAAEVALQYKQLTQVEDLFRCAKSLLRTRPVFHRADETIRGHVFCSFLALVLRKELQQRLEAKGHVLEWADIVRDLEHLSETHVEHDNKHFILRSEAHGTCGKVFQAVGVALPPTIRQLPQDAAS